MEKVLLDTDIGGDIDDAICLAYLLKEPQCELVGITTVCGNRKNGRQSQMQSVEQWANRYRLWLDWTVRYSQYLCILRRAVLVHWSFGSIIPIKKQMPLLFYIEK